MLHAHVSGNGPALVFLHGHCEDHRIWKGLVPVFDSSYQVVCPDLPGFGKSNSDSRSLDEWAHELFQLLDKLEITRFSLIGHSLGAYAGLAMLETQPQRFHSFTFLHSTCLADTEEKKTGRLRQIKLLEQYGTEPYVRQIIPGLFRPGYSGPSLEMALDIAREQTPQGLINALMAMHDRPDRCSLLKRTSVPVAVISGEQDGLLPLEKQAWMAELPSSGYFRVLEQSGHMGQYEEPEVVTRALMEFLKTLNH